MLRAARHASAVAGVTRRPRSRARINRSALARSSPPDRLGSGTSRLEDVGEAAGDVRSVGVSPIDEHDDYILLIRDDGQHRLVAVMNASVPEYRRQSDTTEGFDTEAIVVLTDRRHRR